MFKLGSCEDELYRSMETVLVKNQAAKISYGVNRLVKAADLLNIAAEIFESAGMVKEANDILNILQTLTREINE